MTYRGHVKQGVIVLDLPVQLPEGMEVEVRASEQSWAELDSGDDQSLVSGSIAAALVILPSEDFSDWEK